MSVGEPSAVARHRDDPRYQRLMAATRAAARHGYDAVSMRELADSCRISMTTIYQFCRSKDQLIAEAHLATMEAFRDRLLASPPRGATAEQRLLGVVRSFAKALVVDEQVSRTLLRAAYSVDPAVTDIRASIGTTSATIFDAAIGAEQMARRREVIATLGHVVDSVIFNWLTRRGDAAWVRAELEAAVRALFRAPR